MAASPAPQFFTYAPGSGKAGALQLKPGQTVGFQSGKGYYAKAAPYVQGAAGRGSGYAPAAPTPPYTPPPGRGTPPPLPRPPVDPYGALSPSAIDARASALAQSQLTPQQAEIARQQTASDAEAKAQEDAITGFTKAVGGLQAGISPAVTAAYGSAAQEQGALGQGISGQVGQDLQNAQTQSQDFAAQEGLHGVGSTSSVPSVETTIGMLQGVIPGDQLAAEGAAASTWAAAQPAISIDAGREALEQRLAQAKTADDGYAQQLITLAATYPGLKAQALTQLNQYELDKANYRQSVVMNKNTLANDAATRANNRRALIDQEKAAHIDQTTKVAQINADYNYKYAALKFKSKEDALKAAQAGKIMDVPASKAMGYVVYKDGSSNPSIKVAQSTGGTAAQKATIKANQNKYRDTRTAQETSQKLAVSLLGKPQTVAKGSFNATTGLPYKGKYVADPYYKSLGQGKPGSVFPDGTTNNPRRAAHDGAAHNFAQAQTMIWNQIGGDQLMARYKLSKPVILAWINRSLVAAGWRK